MADVAKIDIDGVQWDIKDLNARNRIAELEKKVIVKITKKINETNIKMNLVEIDNEKFLQLYISELPWDGISGSTVAQFTNDFGLTRTIRGSVVTYDSVLRERLACGIDIRSDGNIRLQPCIKINSTEKYENSKIFGDIFIKIGY